MLGRAIAERGIYEFPGCLISMVQDSESGVSKIRVKRSMFKARRQTNPGYTVRGLPAMAPAQDPTFSRVIRTISINGTRNCLLTNFVQVMKPAKTRETLRTFTLAG